MNVCEFYGIQFFIKTINQRLDPVRLNLATNELGGGSEFIPSMIKFYIHSLANKDIASNDMSKYINMAINKPQVDCYLLEVRLYSHESDEAKGSLAKEKIASLINPKNQISS